MVMDRDPLTVCIRWYEDEYLEKPMEEIYTTIKNQAKSVVKISGADKFMSKDNYRKLHAKTDTPDHIKRVFDALPYIHCF